MHGVSWHRTSNCPHQCFDGSLHLITAERWQPVAWGEAGELKRPRRNPRLSVPPTSLSRLRSGGFAARSQPGNSFSCFVNLGLHQCSLTLDWFTPGYWLPPLRGCSSWNKTDPLSRTLSSALRLMSPDQPQGASPIPLSRDLYLVHERAAGFGRTAVAVAFCWPSF